MSRLSPPIKVYKPFKLFLFLWNQSRNKPECCDLEILMIEVQYATVYSQANPHIRPLAHRRPKLLSREKAND